MYGSQKLIKERVIVFFIETILISRYRFFCRGTPRYFIRLDKFGLRQILTVTLPDGRKSVVFKRFLHYYYVANQLA